MSGDRPWLSVVTVVKDDLAGLCRSLDSLRYQDLTNVELVVIDSSVEQSEVLAVVHEFPVSSAVEWSEPEGVYQAMNRGLALAQGEYIYFLNAGDSLHDPNVVTDLHDLISGSKPEWLVGLVEITELGGHKVTSASWDYQAESRAFFSRGVFPPHQGTVVKTELLLSVGGFNTDYRIAADYAAALSLSLAAKPLMVDRVVACFTEGGLSTKLWKQSFHEFHRARQQILLPSGWGRIVEWWNFSRHFASVWLVRTMRRP